MTRPLKTNPAYAHIAYQKAMTKETIAFLETRYLGVDGSTPKPAFCEDVFQSDAEIPQEEILHFVRRLQQQEADLGLELQKFEFTRRPENEQPAENAKAPSIQESCTAGEVKEDGKPAKKRTGSTN
jgi:hypothetical protein